MPRIFSINFAYKGVERNAMIAVRPTPFATEYTITMLHDELLEELPSKKILSTTTGQFAFVEHSLEEPTDLMKAMIGALAEHVQTSV
ncbi:MAG: hypothetical protein JWP88_25 [Flaviaesturariibacter sp.]|nr:hypothetical protein [Flaviaesturariibacter sp.]